MKTHVEKRFGSSPRPCGPSWGGGCGRSLRAQASESRTGTQMTSVGAAVFVGLDLRKDTHGALCMEILIIRGSETQVESHPLVGNPPPQSVSGVQPNHWKQTGAPPSTVTALPGFLSDQVCPTWALKIVF